MNEPNRRRAQDIVDSRALEIASQTMGQLRSHESDCVRRYDEILSSGREFRQEVRDANKEQRSSVTRLHARINLMLAALIGTLAAITAFMLKLQLGW